MEHTIDYEVKESARAKHIRMSVLPDGRVVVTKPARMTARAVDTFVTGHRVWIQATQQKMRTAHERAERKYGSALDLPKLRRGTKAYKEAVSRARTLAEERAMHFAELGGFGYGRISIRNQSTRWGSCSAPRGGLCNLSFNYRIAHLPQEQADYLIVHELAHTREHNHSPAFWREVGALVPNYQALRKELHRYRF